VSFNILAATISLVAESFHTMFVTEKCENDKAVCKVSMLNCGNWDSRVSERKREHAVQSNSQAGAAYTHGYRIMIDGGCRDAMKGIKHTFHVRATRLRRQARRTARLATRLLFITVALGEPGVPTKLLHLSLNGAELTCAQQQKSRGLTAAPHISSCCQLDYRHSTDSTNPASVYSLFPL